MELRTCSHFHYIQAIKGGITKKVLNVNSRGKPALMFKSITDIYKTKDDVAHKSLPALWLKDGWEENIPERHEFEVESRQILYAERKLVKGEPEVSDCDSGGDTECKNSDVEGDSMTLKQIMEGYKKRKLKQSRSADSSKEKLRADYFCTSPDEDDSDLNVVLSLLKCRLPKRKKVKTKYEERKISTISLDCQLTGKSNPINDQDLPSSSDLPFQANVKLEIPETDETEIQNTICISEKLPLLCDENVNFCLSAGSSADELFLDRRLTKPGDKDQSCVLNSECHEYLEGYDPQALQMARASSTEDSDKYDLETQKILTSDFPASETMEEQFAVTCVPNDGISKASSLTEEQCSDTDISQGQSITHEVACQDSGEILGHLHEMTNVNNLQFPETSHEADVCLTDNDYKDELTFEHETNVSTESTSDCNLNNDQLLLSVDKSPVREKQSQISEDSDTERNRSPGFRLSDAMDEFNQFQEQNLQHPPARLLSTRTTISPTSQERLSKAMEFMHLHDKECKACDEKPYFKQTKHEDGTAEEGDQMKRVKYDLNQEQSIRKSKKRSLAGTAKVHHVGTRSTADQSSSESVIAFTQRQMQDIQSVASKLTNQLQSMKAIAEDRLHVEGNKTTTFKFNLDEVREAIADATKVEASARKWLSIMTRDCSRFCKIMKTTDNGSTASQTETHKIKRKITFADEAGGELCQIRLIESDVEPFAETNL